MSENHPPQTGPWKVADYFDKEQIGKNWEVADFGECVHHRKKVWVTTDNVAASMTNGACPCDDARFVVEARNRAPSQPQEREAALLAENESLKRAIESWKKEEAFWQDWMASARAWAERVQPIIDAAFVVLSQPRKWRELQEPCGKLRNPLAYGLAKVESPLAAKSAPPSRISEREKAREAVIEAGDKLASWALSLNLRPGSNTKEFVAELYTRTLAYEKASDALAALDKAGDKAGGTKWIPCSGCTGAGIDCEPQCEKCDGKGIVPAARQRQGEGR